MARSPWTYTHCKLAISAALARSLVRALVLSFSADAATPARNPVLSEMCSLAVTHPDTGVEIAGALNRDLRCTAMHDLHDLRHDGNLRPAELASACGTLTLPVTPKGGVAGCIRRGAPFPLLLQLTCT